MKETKRNTLLALALICALGFAVIAPAAAHASSLHPKQISYERAIEIATASVGGSDSITEVEWNNKYGQPRYEVEIYRGGRKHEIYIDAVTGNILTTKSESKSKIPAGLTVSEVTSANAAAFAQTALNRVGGGKVAEIKWDRKVSGTVVEIEITDNNGQKHEIYINPATGEITRHKTKNKR